MTRMAGGVQGGAHEAVMMVGVEKQWRCGTSVMTEVGGSNGR
jgi:hypothetical protein